MTRGDCSWVWQSPDWPAWHFDAKQLAAPLAATSLAQGRLLGRLADLGMALRSDACLAATTLDALQTSAIEGEALDPHTVRSSVATRLGMDIGALAPVDRQVDGVVDMVLDATSNAQLPLTQARLFGWHAALFPTGRSGLNPLRVAQWRDDAQGPMQVVSGPVGRRKLHFEAPPAAVLGAEVASFLAWAEATDDNTGPGTAPLLKAGLAHLWFVTVHPFKDGNGRIARAVGDLFLARADGSAQRFYSLSAQLQRERKAYYELLERTQRGSLDATAWLLWFLAMVQRAVDEAHLTLEAVLAKARFWQRWGASPLNLRQIKLLNRLLDGFDGRMTTSRWALIAHCSPDTALRDITELLHRGVLRRAAGGGRSTSYELSIDPPVGTGHAG
jgi:Fic family protein